MIWLMRSSQNFVWESSSLLYLTYVEVDFIVKDDSV